MKVWQVHRRFESHPNPPKKASYCGDWYDIPSFNGQSWPDTTKFAPISRGTFSFSRSWGLLRPAGMGTDHTDSTFCVIYGKGRRITAR
jgi:hypothetical protein